jgi:hypothetical protein
MYPGTAAAAATTQAQNQSIPDFVRGYNNSIVKTIHILWNYQLFGVAEIHRLYLMKVSFQG